MLTGFNCKLKKSISNKEKIISTPHALNHAMWLAVGLRGSSQTPGVTIGNPGLTSLPHPLD